MPSRSSERVQEAVAAVVDDLGQPADIRGDDRHLARHRLERREAEAFLRRRQQKHVGNRQQRQHLILLAEKVDAVVESALVRQPRGAVQLRAVADHEQVRGHAAADAIEDLDDRLHTLDRPEVGHVDQRPSPVRRQSAARGPPTLRRGGARRS